MRPAIFSPAGSQAVLETSVVDAEVEATGTGMRTPSRGGCHGRTPHARLLLRPWRAGDLDAYARLLADPEVVRYISGGRPLPRQRVEAFSADFLAQSHELGFGPFAAIRRPNGEWIGQVGLNRLSVWPDVHNVEVGFELLRPYWGQGLASEGAIASLRFGFETHRKQLTSGWLRGPSRPGRGSLARRPAPR